MGVAHAELANLRLSLQDVLLHDDLDVRLLKLTGKRYRRRDAYAALASPSCCSRLHGGQMWNSAVPNKLKVFTWLHLKDRLITRVNLHSKHVLGDNIWCKHDTEDMHHTFFGCNAISSLWSIIDIPLIFHGLLTPPFGL